MDNLSNNVRRITLMLARFPPIVVLCLLFFLDYSLNEFNWFTKYFLLSVEYSEDLELYNDLVLAHGGIFSFILKILVDHSEVFIDPVMVNVIISDWIIPLLFIALVLLTKNRIERIFSDGWPRHAYVFFKKTFLIGNIKLNTFLLIIMCWQILIQVNLLGKSVYNSFNYYIAREMTAKIQQRNMKVLEYIKINSFKIDDLTQNKIKILEDQMRDGSIARKAYVAQKDIIFNQFISSDLTSFEFCTIRLLTDAEHIPRYVNYSTLEFLRFFLIGSENLIKKVKDFSKEIDLSRPLPIMIVNNKTEYREGYYTEEQIADLVKKSKGRVFNKFDNKIYEHKSRYFNTREFISFDAKKRQAFLGERLIGRAEVFCRTIENYQHLFMFESHRIFNHN